MNRRQFLQYLAGSGVSFSFLKLFASCSGIQVDSQIDPSLRSGIPIIDAHAHPDQLYTKRPPRVDKSSTLKTIKELRMAASSFAAVGDIIFLSRGRLKGSEFDQTKIQLDRVQKWSEEGQIRVILNKADDLNITANDEPPGAIIAIEGGDCIEGDLGKLDYFYQQGVRSITLVHYRINEIGDIMTSPPKNMGLTTFGRTVVDRMEKLGMVVDVAHTHPRTLKDVVSISSKPLVDSHTCLAPVDKPWENQSRAVRRMRDWKQMEWIASTGGLICTWPLAYERGNWKRNTFLDWANETLEMKKRLGMEHVAVGTDGGGMIPWFISGYRDVRDLKKLSAAMLEVGLTQDDIVAFMGGNFNRIFNLCMT